MSDEQTYPTYGRWIVAAATPPTSRSPLNRGKPIIQVEADLFVRVRDWLEGPGDFETRVTGSPMTKAEFDGLVGAGHFLVLPSRRYPSPGSEVWVLRPNHPYRTHALEALRYSGAEPMDGPEDSKIVCVSNADDVLDTWYLQAMEDVLTYAAVGDWSLAEVEANLALATSKTLRADVLGMLCAIYEKQGRVVRADGMYTMALRSRDQAFADAMLVERDRYRSLFKEIAVPDEEDDA